MKEKYINLFIYTCQICLRIKISLSKNYTFLNYKSFIVIFFYGNVIGRSVGTLST